MLVFIVDESFSEGISLMGVKYGHLFDQPTSQFQEDQIKLEQEDIAHIKTYL